MAMLVMIFSGVPTAISFFMCGFFGMIIMTGTHAAVAMAKIIPFFAMSQFDWIVIPLFMMMGIILFETRIGDERAIMILFYNN